ncbi:penicillin-binding transpeptidase domain-containing protein [Maribellus maritimus]|uniref:penicillin-binding transpeptidase domain-containing protein n=1 Tax=Maribellus maritimus TaxID=2870838 RepID=UPI001EEAF24B|nr:penicillin-binding transpeptidase domain-containing protein [Maribellus maritimus]MCG6188580.1 penicillin binding protein transpeptidase domain-containing protein [Maribellus maritimus]
MQPFKDCNVEGSITIYDYNAHKWISSDINDSHCQTLPASTFKILNSLILLEEGLVKSENDIIKWPGDPDTLTYGYRPDIYRDMSLKEAYKLSAVWVYLELSKKVGKKKYKEYLSNCNYGNADLSTDDDDFWNFGHLGISPVNQIEVLVSIYEESLPFSRKSFKTLKEIMVEEKTNSYILRAKTGWTRDGGKDTGWWVGYVERENNVYFFATRLIKDREMINPDFGRCRKEITRTILQQMNILE